MDNNRNFDELNKNETAPEAENNANTAPVSAESVSEEAVQQMPTVETTADAAVTEAPALEVTAAPAPVAEEPARDFSRYQTAAPTYTTTASYEAPRETVYAGTPKTEKKPKAKLGIGAAAILIASCMLLSGGAAFAGTYIANSMTETAATPGSTGKTSTSIPSVVLQSFANPNKTAGTYEQVAAAVAPTVVEITTESIVTDSVLWGGNYITSGAGSGVIISADGLIITNNHVVSGANTITVTTTDGTEYAAEVIGTDSDSDIAVIKVEASNLPFALMGDSDTLVVGQEVIAVGNPLGELGGTVTNGIVSALSRDVNIDGTEMTLIQTNAAVNPGNSGGGLFNLYGELIGIVNAKSSTTSSGTSVEGIGFAIPSNTAAKVTEELINYGYVRGKVMLGITYVDVDTSYEAMYYRVSALGVYIATSEYTDELKPGDRIVAVDGTEVTYGADVKSALKDRAVGDEITVTVVRDGKYVDVKVVLREYVPTEAQVTEEQTSRFESNFGGR
ncbi:MAG: trypsin-like peptidase domain-containing protein [Clostridia bacterium]|nr:trypsin-like peptidase domain-containing protein [Clostridia bacterium]